MGKPKKPARPARPCVFCGAPSQCEEHFWPQWLDCVMPPRKQGDTNTQRNWFVDRTAHGETVRDRTERTRQGHARTRRLKILCRRCNGGWMSAIQSASKPIISALLHNEDTIISSNQQQIIASWATMTAMTSEFSHEPTAAVPDFQRHQFMNLKQPLAGWYIWIGKYKGLQWDTRFYHVGAKTYNPIRESAPPDANNTHSTLFVVGSFLLYVMGSTDLDMINQPNEFAKDISRGFNIRPIWPYKDGDIAWRDIPFNYDLDTNELANLIPTMSRTVSSGSRA